MAYTPTVWQAGDTVTVSKLNKIEQGIVDASLSGGGDGNIIVPIITGEAHEPEDGEAYWEYSCNITFEEIKAAIEEGKTCIGCMFSSGEYINGCMIFIPCIFAIKSEQDEIEQLQFGAIIDSNSWDTFSITFDSDNILVDIRHMSSSLAVKYANRRLNQKMEDISSAFANGACVKFYKIGSSYLTPVKELILVKYDDSVYADGEITLGEFTDQGFQLLEPFYLNEDGFPDQDATGTMIQEPEGQ